MKKPLLLILLVITSVLYSYAQNDPIAVYPAVAQNSFTPKTYYLLSQFLLEKQYSCKLKGKVKAVYDTEYSMFDGKVEKDKTSNKVDSFFDENGNLIKQDFGRYFSAYSYKSNDKNKLVELTSTDGTHESVFSFEYDEKQRVIKRTMGDIVINFTYGLGENPKQVVFTQSGKKWFTATYVYNNIGYSIIEKSDDPKDFFNATFIFINDNLSEIKEIKNNLQKTVKLYKYDLSGNTIEAIDNSKQQREVHTYKFSDKDVNGNWTKRTHFEGKQNGEGSIIIRSIEYYN